MDEEDGNINIVVENMSPGGTDVVIQLRISPDGDEELSFRTFVSSMPPPPGPAPTNDLQVNIERNSRPAIELQPNYEPGQVLVCDIMDPRDQSKNVHGKPLEPLEREAWHCNVICGKAQARISARGPSGSPRSAKKRNSVDDVAMEQSNNNNSPSKSNEAKENIPDLDDKLRNSHVGEKTPHTTSKNIGDVECSEAPPTNKRISNVRSKNVPKPIRVRNMPLPTLPWADSTELSLLMCFKEDIGLTDRSPYIFRGHLNLNPRMRAILFEWLMEVCEVYKMKRVTYYLAIDYVDRYLSRVSSIQKNQLQLIGITCLFIAAKIEEIYPPKLSELAYVTDNACTEQEMLDQEVRVLTKLRWDVQPYTCTGWLTLYLQLASSKTNLRESITELSKLRQDDFIYPQFSPYMFMTASMMMDLCSLDDKMLQFKYSMIAASALYFVQNRETALRVSGYKWEQIRSCVEWMHPFAVVVSRHLNVNPINIPVSTLPMNRSSALRNINSNIVLEEEHLNQNHRATLALLEEVQEERKIHADEYEDLNRQLARTHFIWEEDESGNPDQVKLVELKPESSDEESVSTASTSTATTSRGIKRSRSIDDESNQMKKFITEEIAVQNKMEEEEPIPSTSSSTQNPVSDSSECENPSEERVPRKTHAFLKPALRTSESESSFYLSSDSESEVKSFISLSDMSDVEDEEKLNVTVTNTEEIIGDNQESSDGSHIDVVNDSPNSTLTHFDKQAS